MKIFIWALTITACFSAMSNYATDDQNFSLFQNKNILVIGGTGYLGRAITAELLKYNPHKITIFSRDEVKHFNVTRTFNNNPKVVTLLGDIRDYHNVLKATKDMDIVFHVAALKRIESVEHNVEEGIKTNIIGSLNVYNACLENKVKKVLFMSTDKACWPINAYGASKFVSEKIFTNHVSNGNDTIFVVARFGNILESTGSVIPLFTDKILKGEDLTLTDEHMTRFIITKEEAVKTLFSALQYGIGGEIFVTQLPALKVTDLIEILKEKHNAQNPVKLIGLRPGEKIHETLINESEVARTYEYKGYYIIRPTIASTQPDPEYVVHGRKLSKEEMNDYTSGNEIISKKDLLLFFNSVGVL
ncbi:UDP-N-acetylglucosamine 4,6-dehydratase (inverting) [Candidatus Dependentiae bacterium Noda2021]|nr:UDP-N-acetylglucosamine 4,6-dehydratase (inverting) [Candidatus Dependentiae bacterium Noda2021]